MEVNVKVFDRGNVALRLRNIAILVPEEARKQMHRATENIVKLAKLQAPEHTGALAGSIRIEKSYGVRGRLQLDVVMGGPTLMRHNGKLIDLDEYALEIHENYEEIHPTPGKRTQEKMARHPEVNIGSKFLTRAGEGQEERLTKILAVAITQIIRMEKMT